MIVIQKLKAFTVTIFSMIQSSFAFLLRAPLRLISTTASSSGMKALPADVVKYSQVPRGKVFTKETIPRGLMKEHNTRKGTWGVIHVSQGQLRYQINEPTVSVHIIDSETRGIIEPQIKHEVAALTDDLEFVVEFYRLPGTGPVVEKREGLDEWVHESRLVLKQILFFG